MKHDSHFTNFNDTFFQQFFFSGNASAEWYSNQAEIVETRANLLLVPNLVWLPLQRCCILHRDITICLLSVSCLPDFTPTPRQLIIGSRNRRCSHSLNIRLYVYKFTALLSCRFTGEIERSWVHG